MFYGTSDYDSIENLFHEWEDCIIVCSKEYSKNLSDAIVKDTGDESLYCVYMDNRNEYYFENRTCVGSTDYWWKIRREII